MRQVNFCTCHVKRFEPRQNLRALAHGRNARNPSRGHGFLLLSSPQLLLSHQGSCKIMLPLGSCCSTVSDSIVLSSKAVKVDNNDVPSNWSLHGNRDITARYEILERVGSRTYSDVYRGRGKEDGLIVALKEILDYQSSLREIEALQRLRLAGSPNVFRLYEWFWREHEDAVLVLKFLQSELYSVIRSAKKDGKGIPEREVKAWMIQVLQGVADCHANFVVHRDLKPCNLLISVDGVLKVADFGQKHEANGDIWLLSNYDSQEDIVYPNDPKVKKIKVAKRHG